MKITDKEPQGQKTSIKLQACEMRSASPIMLSTFPSWMHSKLQKGVWRHVAIANVEMISNPDDIAAFVRDQYGFGMFRIMFWNRYNVNAKYSENWVCRNKNECKYYQKGKCRRYSVHKKGEQCPANRRFHPTWSPRLWIEIKQKAGEEGVDDYSFVIHKSLMFYFWFWRKGREKRQ